MKCELRTQTHDTEGEDHATAVWEYEDGPVITLSATTSYPQPTWYYALELHGTKSAYHKSGGGFVDKELVKWFTDGAWGESAPNDATCEWLWSRFAEAPAPVGYDPAIIPGWADGPTSPAFAALKLTPYRVRVFPGSMLMSGTGTVHHWES